MRKLPFDIFELLAIKDENERHSALELFLMPQYKFSGDKRFIEGQFIQLMKELMKTVDQFDPKIECETNNAIKAYSKCLGNQLKEQLKLFSNAVQENVKYDYSEEKIFNEVNRANKHGQFPLIIAAEMKDTFSVKILFHQGARQGLDHSYVIEPICDNQSCLEKLHAWFSIFDGNPSALAQSFDLVIDSYFNFTEYALKNDNLMLIQNLANHKALFNILFDKKFSKQLSKMKQLLYLEGGKELSKSGKIFMEHYLTRSKVDPLHHESQLLIFASSSQTKTSKREEAIKSIQSDRPPLQRSTSFTK